MAKPIFVVKIPRNKRHTNHVREEMQSAQAYFERLVGIDYHVVVVPTLEGDTQVECLNDCKGLPDADIATLIEDYKKSFKDAD